MSNEALIKQINDWHLAEQHNKISETILALPKQDRSNELVSLLGRALNNQDQFESALEFFDCIRTEYSDDPFFCVRYGFALYELHRENEALGWFEKAQEKGLEEINETPGTYHPKSVAKWIMFAERWAPRRIQKNAFEAELRTKRLLSNSENLALFDFDGFWNDCQYSLDNYMGKTPTTVDFNKIELSLGYRLPESYKILVKRHNGGLLIKNTFENPLQCDWAPRGFSVESIYGIDSEKKYSLCGERGNKFWINEWGYPDIGVAIGDGISGGHDMIFLDYSDCGFNGEPCVVHISQESNYELTYLADNFATFVHGLFEKGYDEDDEFRSK